MKKFMEIYIEIMLVLLVFWLVANFWMRFMPQYATQLPLPIYEFLYAFTGAGEGIPQDPTGFFSPEPSPDS
ncbi:MAG TPA: hypothetical protein EYN05_06900 [Nitrospinaceae bacterium]|nr:hypothetical protein [Nitrospinaceae bacterium]